MKESQLSYLVANVYLAAMLFLHASIGNLTVAFALFIVNFVSALLERKKESK